MTTPGGRDPRDPQRPEGDDAAGAAVRPITGPVSRDWRQRPPGDPRPPAGSRFAEAGRPGGQQPGRDREGAAGPPTGPYHVARPAPAQPSGWPARDPGAIEGWQGGAGPAVGRGAPADSEPVRETGVPDGRPATPPARPQRQERADSWAASRGGATGPGRGGSAAPADTDGALWGAQPPADASDAPASRVRDTEIPRPESTARAATGRRLLPIGGGNRRPGLAIPGRRDRTPGTVSAIELARRRGDEGGINLLRLVAFILVLGLVVFLVFTLALRPVIRGFVVGFASDNPGLLGMDFVADLVKEDLGDRLTAPAGSDKTAREFVVKDGDKPQDIARNLVATGVLADARAFLLPVIEKELDTKFRAGTFKVAAAMTPQQLIDTLLAPEVPRVAIDVRAGLRLEQIAAMLEQKSPDRRLETLTMDAKQFLSLVTNPPDALLKDYPWLNLPPGATLEGYLASGTYTVEPDITAEAFVRRLLDEFRRQVGADRLEVAAERGLNWYEVLTLASLVEREAGRDDRRELIAGVYDNRLDPDKWPLGRLQADPTVIYANDSARLRKLDFAKWKEYSFWGLPGKAMAQVNVPEDLLGYQTYKNEGLIPGPICTPTVASIDAALKPDTKDGYLFFVRIPKKQEHAFAKTNAEFTKLLKKYGYQ